MHIVFSAHLLVNASFLYTAMFGQCISTSYTHVDYTINVTIATTLLTCTHSMYHVFIVNTAIVIALNDFIHYVVHV